MQVYVGGKMASSLNKYENLALEASAGTGKTYQLSMRVAGMLLTGVQPRDILCLTFTKKATAEMKERIIKIINDLADNKAEQSELDFITPLMKNYATLLKTEFTDEFIKIKAIEARNNLFTHFSELNIKTIDAFNNSILRIFPFEAGFRPDFNMESEDEINMLKNDAFYEILSDILKNNSWKEIFKKIYVVLGISTNILIDRLKSYADFTAENTIELKNALKNAPSKETINNMLDNAILLQKTIPELCIDFKNTFNMDALNVTQTKAIDKLSQTNIKDIIKISMLKVELGEETPSFKKYTFSSTQYNIHAEIREKLKEYYILYGKIITGLALNLGQKLHSKMKNIKKSLNILTYSDISEEVYYMLATEESHIDKDYLYFRLDSKINHLLIDEFQDTSISQWLSLKPLADESMAGIGQNDKSGSFFYVGDPKQNIYRFRGGSSSLFRTLLKQYKNKLTSKTLDTNYRSGKNIVDIVNFVSNEIYECYKGNFDIFKIDQKSHEKNGLGYVEINHQPDNKDIDHYFVTYSYEKIKQCIEAGYSYKDITILIVSNKQGADLIEYLESKEIPVQVETSAKLTSSPVYNILLSLAEFIETGSMFSFIQYALTSPRAICNSVLESKEQIYKESSIIKSYVENMINSSIFEKLLFLSDKLDLQNRFSNNPDFTATLDIMEQAVYGEKNIVLFKDNLNKAAADIQALSASENNAVTVMTIHKSKGLQFPVVILPNLKADIKLNAQYTTFFVAENDEFGNAELCYVYSQDPANFIKNTEEYKNIEKENILSLQDSVNMLYVAMTRAEQALFINCEPFKDKPTNLSQLLSSILNNNQEIGELKPLQKKEIVERKSEVINININDEKDYLTDFACFNKYNEENITHSYEATLLGTCLHSGLYLLDYNNKDSIKDSEKFMDSRYGALISEENLSLLKSYLYKVYNEPKWQSLFKGRVFKERRIGINNSLYTVDIYSEFNDKIVIMDYKTGNITNNNIEIYEKQLKNYATILKKVYNKNTECFIFHIEKGIINIT